MDPSTFGFVWLGYEKKGVSQNPSQCLDYLDPQGQKNISRVFRNIATRSGAQLASRGITGAVQILAPRLHDTMFFFAAPRGEPRRFLGPSDEFSHSL